MAGRIRTVKPEWLEDEKMVLASPHARVLSIALILEADDYGNGRANETLMMARIFPANPGKSRGALTELRDMGYLDLYSVRGQDYYSINNWSKHQKVSKPGKPRVPAPCEVAHESPEKPGGIQKTPRPDHIPTTTINDHDLDHDHDQPTPVTRAMLERVYAIYPKKTGKAKGLDRAFATIKDPDDFARLEQCVTAMAKAWGSDTQFCPGFLPFVNGRRWQDEDWPMPSVQGGSKQPGLSAEDIWKMGKEPNL